MGLYGTYRPDKEKKRKTNSPSDPLTVKRSDRKIDRRIGRQANRQADRLTDRQAGRQTDRQTDRKTGRQADRQNDRGTDRQTDRHKKTDLRKMINHPTCSRQNLKIAKCSVVTSVNQTNTRSRVIIHSPCSGCE